MSAPAVHTTTVAAGRACTRPTARHLEILDAAARSFNERGYARTSIQDVADAVGMLRGSLYHYIASKDDLLFDVIQDVHRTSLRLLEHWCCAEGDVLSRLRGFVTAHVAESIANRVRVRVFLQDFRLLSEPRREMILEERLAYVGRLRQLIEQGQRDGVVDRGFDAGSVAFGILGMMNWTFLWYQPEGPVLPEQIAQQFADLVLGGIASVDG